MTHKCFLWLARGSFIGWAMLGGAACGEDDHGPASAESTSTSGAGASGSAGAGGSGGGGGSAASGGAGGSGGGGGSAASAGAGGSGGGGGSAASGGAGGSGGGSSHGLTCRESSFPAFSKACEQASDCVVLPHVTTCCGDVLFVGVDADDEEAFEAAEAACLAGSPLCDCPSQPSLAEDGRRLERESEQAVAARCDEGSCTSEIRDLP
ncbi:hypothetical protein ACSRUE_20595 [Sorangium sp. KYC3313]|uniref:hypothetical protein n=1 Tax=Sorangium sp. KYC3313 TaxID=3449740 RepID=UPI003F89AFB1